MEQHTLSQARTTVILTMLASTFIPLAFVTVSPTRKYWDGIQAANSLTNLPDASRFSG
jgi:hypothetical protein